MATPEFDHQVTGPLLSRRALLSGAAGFGGAVALESLAGCSPDSSSTGPNIGRSGQPGESAASKDIVMYSETWLGDEDYARIGDELKDTPITRINAAFAVPGPGGRVLLPEISGTYGKMLQSICDKPEYALSIGGWGDDSSKDANWTHQGILDNFSIAMQKPDKFAASVKEALEKMENKTDVEFSGIDIDMEYPTRLQAKRFIAMMRSLKELMPDKQLTMAMQAEGLAFPVNKLTPYVDGFYGMLYDYATPYDGTTSGSIAPTKSVLRDANAQIAAIGDASKFMPGYEANGYAYAGVTGPDAKFRPGGTPAEVRYRDIQKLDVQTTGKYAGANQAMEGDNWISFESPQQMGDIQKQLVAKHNKLGGAMLWASQDVTAAHVKALHDAMR